MTSRDVGWAVTRRSTYLATPAAPAAPSSPPHHGAEAGHADEGQDPARPLDGGRRVHEVHVLARRHDDHEVRGGPVDVAGAVDGPVREVRRLHQDGHPGP